MRPGAGWRTAIPGKAAAAPRWRRIERRPRVDAGLIERTRDVSRRFFDLPLAEKQRVARPAKDVARGYIGLDEESLARSRDPAAHGSDLNGSLMIGPVQAPPHDRAHAPAAGRHFAPNLWPEQPAELREVWTAYFLAMGELAQTLMRIFALALRLPEDRFDADLTHHISRLRVRNYPAQTVPPQPGQVRAGAGSRRQSLVFFHNPNHDATIKSLLTGEPEKYAPTTSGEHLRQLFSATQNG